jgi:hypothetical protein
MSDEDLSVHRTTEEEFALIEDVPEKKYSSPSDAFVKTLNFFTDKHTIDLTSRQINSIEQLLRKCNLGFVSLFT